MPDLSVELAPNNPLGLRLKNPVMVASGTFGYGTEYTRLVEVSRLGAIIAKGVTLRPRRGNPAPRTVETPAGMLNSIGLQNIGLKALLRDDTEKPPVPLEHRQDVSSKDLHHFVVNYCLDMSASNIERAESHAAKLRKFGPVGAQAVEDFLMDEALEPALDAIPRPLLQGFLKRLRQEVQE